MTSRISPRLGLDAALRQNGAGITLIELILVMAVLATVMAVAAPRFSGFASSRRYDAEWNRFVASVRYARNEAVSRSAPVEIRFRPDGAGYHLSGSFGFASPTTIVTDHVLPAEMAFEFPGNALFRQGAVSVFFGANGTVDEESPQEIRLVERQGGFSRSMLRDPLLGYVVPRGGMDERPRTP